MSVSIDSSNLLNLTLSDLIEMLFLKPPSDFQVFKFDLSNTFLCFVLCEMCFKFDAR